LDNIQHQILNKEDSFSIGAICLKNESIKESIRNSIKSIKKKIIHNLHEQAKSSLETQYESIKNQIMMIDRESDSTETLVSIMNEIKNVRNKEYEMKLTIAPIQDMYKLIDLYKQDLEVDYNATEDEKRKELENNWNDLLKKANAKFDEIRQTESNIKTTLLNNISQLKKKIQSFKNDYEQNGPKQEGLEPKVAANRLSRFKEEYKLLDRNRQQYNSAQDLLGIPKEPFNDLTEMQKEIDTLEKL
jgi:dynein heavy chain